MVAIDCNDRVSILHRPGVSLHKPLRNEMAQDGIEGGLKKSVCVDLLTENRDMSAMEYSVSPEHNIMLTKKVSFTASPQGSLRSRCSVLKSDRASALRSPLLELVHPFPIAIL